MQTVTQLLVHVDAFNHGLKGRVDLLHVITILYHALTPRLAVSIEMCQQLSTVTA